MMVGTARVFMLVAEIMFQKLLNIPCIKAGQDIKNKNKKNMNLIKLKQLDQTELTTFIGTVNDPLYITNPSGYLTFASGVVMTTGNQIISGNKTFSGILFGSGGWSISGGDFLINYEKHWDNIVNTAAVSKRAVDGKFIPLTGNATNGYPNLITGMTAIGMIGPPGLVFSLSNYPTSITTASIAGDAFPSYTSGLDMKNRRLYDAGVYNRGLGGRPGGINFQTQNKKLIDTIGLTSVDWDLRRLFVTDGVAYTGIDSTDYSLDYQTREVNGLWSYNATFIGPISGMSAQGMTSPYINGGLSDTVVIFLTGNSDGTPAYNKSSILLYDGEKLDIITYSTGNNFMQWPTGSATSKIAVSWPDGVIHSGTSGNANTGYYNSYTMRSITGLYGVPGVGSASQYGWSRFFVKHNGTYT